MGFNVGDRIRFPDPREDGIETEGFFLDLAEAERIEVPGPDDATYMNGAAWVWRDDGTTARVPYGKIRRV
jgi:hypothetical protein